MFFIHEWKAGESRSVCKKPAAARPKELTAFKRLDEAN